jgi:transposase-like protein
MTGTEAEIQTGVYSITTPMVNDLIYIGSASSKPFKRRWTVHRSALAKGVHHSPRLQKVVREHGLSVLSFEVLERCAAAGCLKREQFWIDSIPSNRRYNVNPRAESRLGSKFTPAQCQRLIESHGGVASSKLREQIITEYLQGSKLTTLARKYNVTRGTIRNYVCRSGGVIRPLPTRNDVLRTKITQAYAAGRGVKQLARIHGLDYDTVMRILTRAGAVMRTSGERQRARFQDIEARKRLAIEHGGKTHRFVHRTDGFFQGYAVELAARFELSVHNINAVARGERQAYKGWEICNGKPHVWNRPEHRQYARGADHPMAKKLFDLKYRRAMARKIRKCSDSQIAEIYRLLSSGVRQSEIAQRFGVHRSVVSRINTASRHYAEFRDESYGHRSDR